MNKPIVINLFAGPSCGKSQVASGVCSLLKMHEVNCELITEFARDVVYEKRCGVLEDRCYMVGKQYHKMFRTQHDLDNKPEILVTDSPLLFNLVYRQETLFKEEEDYILRLNDKFFNINYFIERDSNKKYNLVGRYQKNICECAEIDCLILKMFGKYRIDYKIIKSDGVGINEIVTNILDRYNIPMKFYIMEEKR